MTWSMTSTATARRARGPTSGPRYGGTIDQARATMSAISERSERAARARGATFSRQAAALAAAHAPAAPAGGCAVGRRAMVPANAAVGDPARFVLAVAALAALSPPAAAQERSRIRIAIPGDDGSLTPYTFESGYAFMTLVYDTLTWRDATGIARPWLARSVAARRAAADGDRVAAPRGALARRQAAHRRATSRSRRVHARRPHPRFTPQLRTSRASTATGELAVSFTCAGARWASRTSRSPTSRSCRATSGRACRAAARAARVCRSAAGRIGSCEPPARAQGYRFAANRDYFRGAPRVAAHRRAGHPARRQARRRSCERGRRRPPLRLTVPPGPRSASAGLRFSDGISYTGTVLAVQPRRRAVSPARRAARRRARAGPRRDRAERDRRRRRRSCPPIAACCIRARAGRGGRAAPLRSPTGAARWPAGARRVPRRCAAQRPGRLEAGRQVVRALTAAARAPGSSSARARASTRALGGAASGATFDAAVLGIPRAGLLRPGIPARVFGDPAAAPLNDGGYRSAGVRAPRRPRRVGADARRARDAVGGSCACSRATCPSCRCSSVAGRSPTGRRR